MRCSKCGRDMDIEDYIFEKMCPYCDNIIELKEEEDCGKKY